MPCIRCGRALSGHKVAKPDIRCWPADDGRCRVRHSGRGCRRARRPRRHPGDGRGGRRRRRCAASVHHLASTPTSHRFGPSSKPDGLWLSDDSICDLCEGAPCDAGKVRYQIPIDVIPMLLCVCLQTTSQSWWRTRISRRHPRSHRERVQRMQSSAEQVLTCTERAAGSITTVTYAMPYIARSSTLQCL